MSRVLTTLLLTLLALATRAQETTVGTEFWGCHLENTNNAMIRPLTLIVANPGTVTANVTLEGNTGLLATASVTPGATGRLDVPLGRMMFGTSLWPNAVRLSSDQPVAAWQFAPWELVTTNDTSTLLPITAWGTEHRAVAWPTRVFSGGTLRSLIAIVSASMELTTVTVTPAATTEAGFIPSTPAGTPVTFTFSRFDAAQITAADDGADLTGSLIVSDHPVAVFSGHVCANIPVGADYCDHLEEQLVPITKQGTRFVAVKSEPRASEPDVWRIVASSDGTTITTTPDVLGGSRTLDAGEMAEISTAQDFELGASAPLAVAHYFVSNTSDATIPAQLGDPSMTLLVPTAQFDTSYIFVAPDTYADDYVSLVVTAGGSVTLDGTLVASATFVPVAGGAFERARVSIADGPHVTTSTLPFSVESYGYDVDSSYASFAGARLAEINAGGLKCDSGGPYSACGAPARITLDASRSTGPGTLTFAWSSFTPGVTFVDPTAVVTAATFTGSGPWTIVLTVSNGLVASSCMMTVIGSVAPVPGEVSATAPYLHVAKVVSPAAAIQLRCAAPADPGVTLNFYAGSLLRSGIVAYDHAPLVCATTGTPAGPGVTEFTAPFVAGASHYYLVSASSCAGEGTRGFRSDGVERPSLSTDCGP